jgi:hypothetical protein
LVLTFGADGIADAAAALRRRLGPPVLEAGPLVVDADLAAR